ncbi:hypothetical protein ABC347_03410 [Sphingomonas sp. 1P06PA]|uniref:hypothetical protein n=1 Tax=Sphingomonas sp. 1P06PA TaxID=554121 RepID=UPI0039A6E437
MLRTAWIAAALCALVSAPIAAAEMQRTPDRRADEGGGPYPRLVIRGATVIEGNGGPPRGPVDIVIEGNRIAAVRSAGTPGLPLEKDRPPAGADREIDATCTCCPASSTSMAIMAMPTRHLTPNMATSCGWRMA